MGRLYGVKGNIEPLDLVPVSVVGGAGLGVCGSDCGLDLVGIGLAVTQRLAQQAGRLRDHFHVPERPILLIQGQQSAIGGHATVSPRIMKQHERQQPLQFHIGGEHPQQQPASRIASSQSRILTCSGPDVTDQPSLNMR